MPCPLTPSEEAKAIIDWFLLKFGKESLDSESREWLIDHIDTSLVHSLALREAAESEVQRLRTSLAEQRVELERLPPEIFASVGIASTHKMLVKLLVDQIVVLAHPKQGEPSK